jgi:predicted phosphodiesterase
MNSALRWFGPMLIVSLMVAGFMASRQAATQGPDTTSHPRSAASASEKKQPSARTPANFKIAFIGDQGAGADAEAVLHLIKEERASAVVHLGDFDYRGTPTAWEARINNILGAQFPYFACVGNHDEDRFYGADGYQDLLEARMQRLGIAWDGDLGVKSSFVYQGVFFILTAPDVFGSGHAEFIREKLADNQSLWSISGWHKNMRRMQAGGKGDETGWEVYEESRKGGAIIATAHEHSYSRTHLLSSCENQIVASRSDTLTLAEDNPKTPEDEGRTFVFVSGLGGKSIRDQELSGDWWASIYTSTQGANHGALFGVFNCDGIEGLAKFYFKNINGVVPDEFFVRSNASASGLTVESSKKTSR